MTSGSLKLSFEWLLIVALSFLKLLLHLLTNTHYELHRDGLLYMAQGAHMDWSFLSVPPAIALLGNIARWLGGDSIFVIRLFPAFFGAISVMAIGHLILYLGGKRWAILLGCGAYVLSPAYLRTHTLLQPVFLDQFFWLVATLFMIKLLKSQNTHYWLYLHITWSLAFWAKYNIIFLIFAFIIALLLSPKRSLIASRHFWQGACATMFIVLPILLWQYRHNFPVVYHMTHLRETQLLNVRISDFIMGQLLMNIPGILIWLSGALFLLFDREGRQLRVIGFTFLIVMSLYLVASGKGYYTLGIYPVLLVAGGLAIEKRFTAGIPIIKPIMAVMMILIALPIMPFSLPLLPLDQMAYFCEKSKPLLGDGALRWEDGRVYPLPQDYADMTGWRELGSLVGKAYQGLSPDERKQSMVFTENYGQAGAIAFYGKAYGVPEPVSFDESFLFWAPDSCNSQILFYVNNDTTDVTKFFTTVELIGRIQDPYARESGLPVWICRGPRNGFARFYADKSSSLKNQFRRSNP